MTVLFRCRVDEKALAKANAVTRKLGTKTPEIVRMLIRRIGETGTVPFAWFAGEDELVGKTRRNWVLRDIDDSEGW